MPQVTVTVHPNGLHPIEAVKAFYKRSAEHRSLDEIVEEGELMNISKKLAGRDAINSAILRVENMSWGDEVIQYVCWDANESTIVMAGDYKSRSKRVISVKQHLREWFHSIGNETSQETILVFFSLRLLRIVQALPPRFILRPTYRTV